ncbi:MAG: hypothetical protein OES57_07210 [Acidimicrobiia bacterium]|nr:hypothetical protein [Acidimicrobiia bacterium]
MKKLLSTAAFSLAALTLVAGCGESVDREGTVDDLVEQSNGSVSRAQAECMVDGWIEELGEDRALELNDEDPTEEEEAAISQITLDCLG